MRAYELLKGENPVKREISPFPTEEKLEHLLNRIPSLLLDEQILLIGRQVTVETGTLDLLGIDKFGNVVVFELKKGKSGSGSASEESILSQPQQYAQALQWFTYDDLDQVFAEYRTESHTKDWLPSSDLEEESLVGAFNTFFGRPVKPENFNQFQRMVIVAEEVTDQTAANARYLRDEGLNLQCVEVQRFRLSENEGESPILVASTVVDYDNKRVQPRGDQKPNYATTNEAIITRAFPKFKEITKAPDPEDLFPKGFDCREPRMRSRHPGHPDPVRYTLRVRPLESESVRISIDITTRGLDVKEVNKDKLADHVRTAETRFEDAGFAVSHKRNTFRVVEKEWPVDNLSEIRNEAFLNNVAERYAELVNIGHEVMLESDFR
ncbi:hypothetical protein ACLI4Q_16235 [Natrialbaceae archaeon A-CW1-1]